MGPTLGQLGVGAPLNLNNPLAMNPALANPLLSLNPQLLALLSNPLLSQGLTGMSNPSQAPPDQSSVLSQMSQLAQLLQGGGNTGLNLGYGGSTQSQPLQNQQNQGQVNLEFKITHTCTNTCASMWPNVRMRPKCFNLVGANLFFIHVSSKIQCNTLPICLWPNKTWIRPVVAVIITTARTIITTDRVIMDQGTINVATITDFTIKK